MGCHTILGEGAYYAPELTKVYERRGPEFIKAMLRDPEAMYPGQRRMVKYDFTDEEMEAMVAFLKWIGEMDLNGFPPEPTLLPVTVPTVGPEVVAAGFAPAQGVQPNLHRLPQPGRAGRRGGTGAGRRRQPTHLRRPRAVAHRPAQGQAGHGDAEAAAVKR